MDRRRFLELLGLATAGATVAYSFPSIIIPQNIIPVETELAFSEANEFTLVATRNWIDFYAEQVVMAKDWFQVATPLWNAVNDTKVTEGGVRLISGCK